MHKKWTQDIKGEKCITQYDKKNTVNEQIAEAVKLFLTNPNLLKIGRLKRYNFLINKMNLIPLHDVDWQIILQYAHPKYVSATQNWIK